MERPSYSTQCPQRFSYHIFFNDTATPEIDTSGTTLSLHAALPFCLLAGQGKNPRRDGAETGPNQLAPHFAALVQAAIAKTRQYDQSPITPPFGRGAFVDASRRLPR